jgi:PhoH-like ATPase
LIYTYVLDTNVLLLSAESIYKFDEHNVIIPITVLEELDNFKKNQDELGRNARQVARQLDTLRMAGSLVEGVQVNSKGGTLRIALYTSDMAIPSLDPSVADNRILAVALDLPRKDNAILVSRDINLRIKADALGLEAEDFENNKIAVDDLYPGFRTVSYESGFITTTPVESLYAVPSDISCLDNEYILLTCPSHPELVIPTRYSKKDNILVRIDPNPVAWGLSPRNTEQMLAMDLLLNDDIKLVTLVGKAGTGKTLMAIAAGLNKVAEDFKYSKMLVSRPVFPMGKDIGFLPGDLEEKLNPWMQPIYDNVEFLLGGYSSPTPKLPKPKKRVKREGFSPSVEEEKEEGRYSGCHKELVALGIMQIEPLMYIRGRSIPKQYMIIDEAQNLTPHEVKTIITRAGEGTKIVLTGDPYQIDHPFLDASSNGLTYVVERMKAEAIAGHITLTKGERSELAEIASNLL